VLLELGSWREAGSRLESGGRCGLRCAVTPPLARHFVSLRDMLPCLCAIGLHEQVTPSGSLVRFVSAMSCELRPRKTRTTV
jgi:hypothetical protein